MALVGHLEFPFPLMCKKEALTAYTSYIDEFEIKIIFPQYVTPSDTNHALTFQNPLAAPFFAKEWKLDGKPLQWGEPWDYPAGNSLVTGAAILVICEENSIEETAQRIYETFDDWLDRFIKYCMLCNKQIARHKDSSVMQGQFIHLMSSKYIPPKDTTIRIEVDLRTDDQYLSRQNIEDACLYASKNVDLLTEYQLMLSAYNALGKAENRQAVIDSSAALELCLVKQIIDFCISKGINEEILNKKYRTLGDRVELMQLIDNSISQYNLKENVVYPRNNIAHNKDISPTSKTAYDAIRTIEATLKHYYSDFYEH